MLAFGCPVSDFTLTANAKGIFQCMMGFPFVQPNLGSALHIGIQNPVYHEQGALYPADFTKGCGQVILTGIGCKFTQDLAGGDGTCSRRCCTNTGSSGNRVLHL